MRLIEKQIKREQRERDEEKNTKKKYECKQEMK